jgi:hypothetical protein
MIMNMCCTKLITITKYTFVLCTSAAGPLSLSPRTQFKFNFRRLAHGPRYIIKNSMREVLGAGRGVQAGEVEIPAMAAEAAQLQSCVL